MRYFTVNDRIEKKLKKFYSFGEAKEEANRLIKIYMTLNSRVRLEQKDGNFYIYLKEKQ